MKLYDHLIRQALGLLASGADGHLVQGQSRGETCQDSGGFDLILKSDMAYELGGRNFAGCQRPSVHL